MFCRINNSRVNYGNNNNNNNDTSECNNSLSNHSNDYHRQLELLSDLQHNNNSPPKTQYHPQQEQYYQHKMSTASSFDVIRSGSFSSMLSITTMPPNSLSNPFSAHFEAINRLPVDHWLKGKSKAVKEINGNSTAENGPPNTPSTFMPSNHSMMAPIIPDLAAMMREMQLQQEKLPQEHPQQRKRTANAGMGNVVNEGAQIHQIDWKAKSTGWLKSDAASAMWSSPSCATVITGILASSLEDWLAQPPAAKIARRQHQTPQMASIMGQPKQQQLLWAPSWATTANSNSIMTSNANGMHEEHKSPANNSRRSRTDTFNSSCTSLTISEAEADVPANYYNFKHHYDAREEENELAEHFEAEENDKNTLSFVNEMNFMVSKLESIRPKLEQMEETLKIMIEQMKGMIMNGTLKKHQQKDASNTQQQLFTFQPPQLTMQVMENMKEAESENEEEKKNPIALKLSSDPAHWLKKYPPPKNRPMNEMAEDLSCWESVLGWKSILEKIHASGEHVWLAPSSRTIKN